MHNAKISIIESILQIIINFFFSPIPLVYASVNDFIEIKNAAKTTIALISNIADPITKNSVNSNKDKNEILNKSFILSFFVASAL